MAIGLNPGVFAASESVDKRLEKRRAQREAALELASQVNACTLEVEEERVHIISKP
jgi:hypothetical protein